MFQESQIDHTKELTTLNHIAIDNLLNTCCCKLVTGACLVRRQKPNLGWQRIGEACDMVHQILDQRHPSFFRYLLSALDSYEVTLQPDLRAHILRFFMKASALKWGCNHPISIILYHLQEQQILEDVTIIAFEVLMDVARENLDPTDPEVWYLRERYCEILKERLQWAAAESCGQRFLKQCEDVLGQFHFYSRLLLLELSSANYAQGLPELAERQLQDVLQRGREGLEDQFPDWTCIHALNILALIWEDRGDFTQSEEYWRQVLAGAIKQWGEKHEATVNFLVNVERSFKRQGKDPEAWLQQNFGVSCV